MMYRVWMLEDCDGNYEIFHDLDVARDFAYQKMLDWGYNPDEDEYEVFKVLEESYQDEKHPGFWVDELLWCYEVNYHY